MVQAGKEVNNFLDFFFETILECIFILLHWAVALDMNNRIRRIKSLLSEEKEPKKKKSVIKSFKESGNFCIGKWNKPFGGRSGVCTDE